MKLRKKITTHMLPLMLVLLIGGLAMGYGYWRYAQANHELEQQVQPSITQVLEAQRVADQYILQLQNDIIQFATGQRGAVASTGRKDPREAFQQYQTLAQTTGVDPAEITTLGKHFETLVGAARSLDQLISNAQSNEAARSEREGEAKRNNNKPATADKDKAEAPSINTALAARQRELDMLRADIATQVASLRTKHELQRTALSNSADTHQLILLISMGITLVLGVLLAMLAWRGVRSAVLDKIHVMTERLNSRKALPEDEDEFGNISAYVNHLRREHKRLSSVLTTIGKGDLQGELPHSEFDEEIAVSIGQITHRLKTGTEELAKLQNESNSLKTDYQSLQKSNIERETRIKALEADLHKLNVKFNAVESTLAIAELDGEGRVVYADNLFAKLMGYSFDELKGVEFAGLQTKAGNSVDIYNQMWQTVQSGNTWYGVFQNQNKTGKDFWLASAVTPLKGTNGSAGKYLLAGYEISALKTKEQELQQSIGTLKQDIERYRGNLEQLQDEQHKLLSNYQSQKQLENRLVQQQSALQELTRNSDLKEGNVREALRTITESTAYALEDDRVGLWLFIENAAKLRCLDVFERQRLAHREGTELRKELLPDFFNAIQHEGIFSVDDAQKDSSTAVLYNNYLVTHNVGAVLSAPIRLGGMVVGILFVEHVGSPRNWTLDEQNFVMSVADVVSLALEQGNRKVMEQELRTTLEESHALEEELRQNAEEIEATNEEMRRTQLELRGQINALNNAAIVSETNTQGVITYANQEFTRIYGYDRTEVLGQNHRILKTSFHPAAFYEHMWRTITSGKVWKGEIKNKAKSGEEFWILLTLTPVLGVDGKPFKFIGVAFNITAQKLQENQIKQALDVALQQEELLRQNAEELEYANEEMRRTQIELAGQINALNNSSMVYETDMEGIITYVNDELLAVSKFSRDELIGKRYTLLKSGRQPDAIYQDQWRSVQGGKIWRGELENRNAAGEFFWVVVTSTPVLNDSGDPVKTINVLVDITTQKNQEFRLKKQQSALLELTSMDVIKDGQVDESFRIIAKVGSEVLGASRTAIWMYDDNGKVRCNTVFEGGIYQPVDGTELDKEIYPIYFRTLERDRVLAANDAMNDVRTKEMAYTLFQPQGTTAVLDACVRQGGRPVGLISFEHRNTARQWTLDEQNFATSLADIVGLVLEQRERLLTDKLKLAYNQLEERNQEIIRQKAEIEEQNEHVKHSIKYAKRIQNNILPSKEVLDQYLQSYFIIYRPRDVVGGDFYWYANVEGKHIIVVADGTGHGVPGAFLTLIGYLLLNQIVHERNVVKPAEILYWLHIGVRTALKQDEEGSESRDGMDVAVCMYDPATLEAQYAGANLPFNYYQDGDLHVIKSDKYSIGGEQMEEERTFNNHSVQMKPGDGIYLYTDGFVDQMGGPDEKRFSTKRFRDLVLRTQHESMATQRALVNIEWKEWKDDREQLDDVTLFGFRI